MNYTIASPKQQAGMTMIELTVVMLVMVAMAGVAVPYVAGMADKAHDSTTASTINQLNQTIAKFRTDHNALPERLETLTDSNGTLIDYFVSKQNYPSDNIITATDPNASADPANVVLSLQRAGMTYVYQNKLTGFVNNNHTFGAPASKVLTSVADFAYVGTSSMWGGAALDTVSEHLAYALGGNADDYDTTCYSYVAMGVGDNSELIGKGLQTAPVLFVPNGDLGPENKYGRFIAIFKTQSVNAFGSNCPDQIQPAEFIGVVANMDFGALVGSSASQQWSTSNSRMNK